MRYIYFLFAILPVIALAQNKATGQKYRYNFSDTLMSEIKQPYFLSEKVVWFDSTFTETYQGGGGIFKIGKVCNEIGCVGDFDGTGLKQAGYLIVENKIIVSFYRQYQGYISTWIMVWRWQAKDRKFHLLQAGKQ